MAIGLLSGAADWPLDLRLPLLAGRLLRCFVWLSLLAARLAAWLAGCLACCLAGRLPVSMLRPAGPGWPPAPLLPSGGLSSQTDLNPSTGPGCLAPPPSSPLGFLAKTEGVMGQELR